MRRRHAHVRGNKEEKHARTNNMKVTVKTNFGLAVRFGLIFLAEFSIIAQRLLAGSVR